MASSPRPPARSDVPGSLPHSFLQPIRGQLQGSARGFLPRAPVLTVKRPRPVTILVTFPSLRSSTRTRGGGRGRFREEVGGKKSTSYPAWRAPWSGCARTCLPKDPLMPQGLFLSFLRATSSTPAFFYLHPDPTFLYVAFLSPALPSPEGEGGNFFELSLLL